MKQKSLEKNKKTNKSFSKGLQEKEHIFRDVFLKEVDIENSFNLIKSKRMAKFIGLFAHLSYWLVFGHVNPIELDLISKKQIFVQLYEILMEFNAKAKVNSLIFIINVMFLKKSQKIWIYITLPLILLTLKMETEFIFRISYPLFFEEEEGKPDVK